MCFRVYKIAASSKITTICKRMDNIIIVHESFTWIKIDPWQGLKIKTKAYPGLSKTGVGNIQYDVNERE